MTLRCSLLLMMLCVLLAGAAFPAAGWGQPSAPPEQLDEFVPIDQLPQAEQIPAANLLVAAYAFVWLAVFAYVVSVSRRLGTVEREMERLERDLTREKP